MNQTQSTEPTWDVAVRDDNVPILPGQSFFEALRATGMDAFEMWVSPDNSLPCLKSRDGAANFSLRDPEQVAALKAQLQSEGAQICALCLPTDFGGPQAEEHVAWAIDAVRAARALGAPAVRLDPWTRNAALTPEQIQDNFARCATQILEATQETGVDLGIENHGRVANDRAFLDGIFARVGDPRLGMTLDTGNFYWSGLPLTELYEVIEHFAPLARHTHIKSIAYPAPLRETRREPGYEYERYNAPIYRGDIDMMRVVRTLRGAGYRRALCIEDEGLSKFPMPERAEVLRREAAALRAALAA